jgi:hypothetical protein
MAKIGIEVEGRFKGIKTLFIQAEEFDDALRIPRECNHIYISDNENTLDLSAEEWDAWTERWLITVDVTDVCETPRPGLNIMLRIDHPSFWYLKPTDQIKFEQDKNVWTIPVESMYRTFPEDFEGDIQL